MTFIPEEEYQKILKTMPVFCGDFLIFAEKKYLLIKRKEEPVKDVYWVIGGRLRFKETMAELADSEQIIAPINWFANETASKSIKDMAFGSWMWL